MQVPVGTEACIVDKVFAAAPQLQPLHLAESLGLDAADPSTVLPEPSVDASVSADAARLGPVFASLRELQARMRVHSRGPLTIDRLCALQPVHGLQARRRCVACLRALCSVF